MKIKYLAIVALVFMSCSGESNPKMNSTTDVIDGGPYTVDMTDVSSKIDADMRTPIPTNCRKFDGDPVACAENRCNQYFDEGPTICIVNGVCTRDNGGSGVCAYFDPEYANNGIISGVYRVQDDFVISSSRELIDTQWLKCPEDGGSPVCQCFWDDDRQEIGSCP